MTPGQCGRSRCFLPRLGNRHCRTWDGGSESRVLYGRDPHGRSVRRCFGRGLCCRSVLWHGLPFPSWHRARGDGGAQCRRVHPVHQGYHQHPVPQQVRGRPRQDARLAGHRCDQRLRRPAADHRLAPGPLRFGNRGADREPRRASGQGPSPGRPLLRNGRWCHQSHRTDRHAHQSGSDHRGWHPATPRTPWTVPARCF